MTAPPLNRPPIDPRQFAESTRALLAEDPRRYRLFGQYWYLVKALLKMNFDHHQMPILGDYIDHEVVARMPQGMSAADLLVLAAEEYQHNAAFNLGRNQVEDSDGEFFTLLDPDIDT